MWLVVVLSPTWWLAGRVFFSVVDFQYWCTLPTVDEGGSPALSLWMFVCRYHYGAMA